MGNAAEDPDNVQNMRMPDRYTYPTSGENIPLRYRRNLGRGAYSRNNRPGFKSTHDAIDYAETVDVKNFPVSRVERETRMAQKKPIRS